MKTTAALYARVSTQQQEDAGTIASQVASLEAYAQEKQYALRPELYFLDDGVSGARLDRPGLERLRDLAGEGLFDVVICLSPDRLSRQYAHQWILMDELRRQGVEMVFANQAAVEDNPQSQLFLGIQGLFAEYERAMITERLRRGRLYKARQGKLLSPCAPYGYRYVRVAEVGGARWELETCEVSAVCQIYHWYTQAGMTIGEITLQLEKEKALYPPRNEKYWSRGTVRNILTQAAYVGQTYYNRTQRDHEIIGRTKLVGRGKRRWSGRCLRPESEWIPIVVPPIIAVTEWEAAQERLITNRKFAGRNNKKHSYLLRSLLVCQTCGRTLIGRTRQNGYTTYACCYRPGRISPDIPKHTCTIAARIIEPMVWQAVCELLSQPEKIEMAWEREKMGHVQDGTGEPDRVSHRMSKLKQQQERLLDLYQDGQIEKDTFVERKERIEQEYQVLQQQQHGLIKQAEMAAIQQKAITDLAGYAQRIQENLDDPSPELQQEVIRLLIDHISIGEQEIVIKHIVPDFENGCLSLQRKNSTQKFQSWF